MHGRRKKLAVAIALAVALKGKVFAVRGQNGPRTSYETGALAEWVTIAGGVQIMKYEASRPDATATSAGAMGGHACSKAGVLPWTNIKQPDAEAVCAAMGARMCTETEWQTACQATTGACTWSYTPAGACATYSSTTCNGVDNDIDGVTPPLKYRRPAREKSIVWPDVVASNRRHSLPSSST